MADPGAPSGAVAEITFTAGLGSYQLSPTSPNALAAYFRFADVYPSGSPITVEVDDTAKKEIVTGIFDGGSNTISRDQVLFSSNANQLVDWPVTGQRAIRPLVNLPICATPPTVGQVLAWDGIKWCPITITIPNVPPGFAVCNTPPADGEVLIWSVAENAWCPANFCALVAACP